LYKLIQASIACCNAFLELLTLSAPAHQKQKVVLESPLDHTKIFAVKSVFYSGRMEKPALFYRKLPFQDEGFIFLIDRNLNHLLKKGAFMVDPYHSHM